MKTQFATFLVCFFTFALLHCFASDLQWAKTLNPLLPQKVSKIEVKKSHRSDVEQLLGKASLVENNKHYYELDGFKYALEIVYHKNVVSEFSYTFIEHRPSLLKLKLPLDMKKLVPYQTGATGSSRYFQHSDSEGEIVIDPISKDIYSVRFRK